MDGATLQATVARYNTFVDTGTDVDFGKPRAPVQAPGATILCCLGHATGARHARCLRINVRCQVVDMLGQVIPALYCGGESAGGFTSTGWAAARPRGTSPGHTPP